MSSASIETTLELWASSLRDVKARMRGMFTQECVFHKFRDSDFSNSGTVISVNTGQRFW